MLASLEQSTPVATASSAAPTPTPTVAPAPVVEDDGYITGPIVPVVAQPVARAARLEVPVPFEKQRPEREEPEIDPSAPIGGEDDDADEDDGPDLDEDDESDDDADDETDADDDQEGDEDESDDEDDEDIEAEDEAIFNGACAAVELGHRLTWMELVTYLCTAEVKDPRLALLATLLVETDGTGQLSPLTGARVLEVLSEMGFSDIVDEARETVGLSASTETEPAPVAATTTPPKRGKGPRPLHASDVRARKTALGTTVAASTNAKRGEHP